MDKPRKITGFQSGDPLRIQRRVGRTRSDLVKGSLVYLKIHHGNQIILSKQTQFNEDKPIDSSIPGSNIQDPNIRSFYFDLNPEETSLIQKDQIYNYSITSGSEDPHVHKIESGLLQAEAFGSGGSSPPPPPPIPPLVLPGDPNYSSPTAYTSYADACQTVTGRTALVIDGYVDAIIGAYRQLKVWDEHARRRADNPAIFQLTYENINHFTPIEVWDGNNNPVVLDTGSPSPGPPPPPPSPPTLGLVNFDYRNGTFSISGDDGNQDFFVTYSFDFFPENVLVMFVHQTVLELNFIGVDGGAGYLTNYTSIESIPDTWLGLVALGVAAKAWKKLASDVMIWRNWLIFDGDVPEGIQAPTGAGAQQMANDASQYYQNMYETFAAASKYDKFLAQPTIYYQIFSTSGYGSFGPYVMGNKVVDGNFRGMVVNKGWSY